MVFFVKFQDIVWVHMVYLLFQAKNAMHHSELRRNRQYLSVPKSLSQGVYSVQMKAAMKEKRLLLLG